ncbi:MAG: tRNA (adenosine(37)-N6)-dimethylallyltransferase MiaA, partial [Akkermansiaceae bacterium]
LAVEMASIHDGEIVNADAYQLYKGLEIISAAPSKVELAQTPHHLYGVLHPSELCDAMQFRTMALSKIQEIKSRGKTAIITGGSGLYLKFLSHGPSAVPSSNESLRKELENDSDEILIRRLSKLDPEGAAATNLKNRRYVIRALEICILSGRKMSEVKSDWKKKNKQIEAGLRGVYLQWDRDRLRERINIRAAQMINDGAVDEVANLETTSATCEKAIGIPQIRSYLKGDITIDECRDKIAAATRQYAKRQRTWFGKENWLIPCPVDENTGMLELASELSQKLGVD